MDDEQKRSDQLRLLAECLARPDLTRGQIVVFTDMRTAVAQKGVILSEAHERWLTDVKNRTYPEVGPESVRTDVKAMTWWENYGSTIVLGAGVVSALTLGQFLLTFLLHWLGWR